MKVGGGGGGGGGGAQIFMVHSYCTAQAKAEHAAVYIYVGNNTVTITHHLCLISYLESYVHVSRYNVP